MAAQHFFLGKDYLGCREIATYRVIQGLDIVPQRSIHYFCPRCGEIWARLIHEAAAYHQVFTRRCSAHGEGRIGTLPSNILGEPSNVAADWPAKALRYEFLAELTFREKE